LLVIKFTSNVYQKNQAPVKNYKTMGGCFLFWLTHF
jgi:hypothetical protein